MKMTSQSKANHARVETAVHDRVIADDALPDKYGASAVLTKISEAGPATNQATGNLQKHYHRALRHRQRFETRRNKASAVYEHRDQYRAVVAGAAGGAIGILMYSLAFIPVLIADLFIGQLLFSYLGSSGTKALLKASGFSLLMLLSGKVAGHTLKTLLSKDAGNRGKADWSPLLMVLIAMTSAVVFITSVATTARNLGVALPIDTVALIVLVSLPVTIGLLFGWFKPDGYREAVALVFLFTPVIAWLTLRGEHFQSSGLKALGKASALLDRGTGVAEQISNEALGNGAYYSPKVYDSVGGPMLLSDDVIIVNDSPVRHQDIRTMELMGIGPSKADLQDLRQGLSIPFEPAPPKKVAATPSIKGDLHQEEGSEEPTEPEFQSQS